MGGSDIRRCSSWIDTFLEWTKPRSEAPESLLLWSGLFAISSVVKRNVSFPASILGSYTLYPNLYIIFIGPPGAVRKSTTAGFTEDLLRELKGVPLAGQEMLTPKLVTLGPTSGSDAKLIEQMSSSPDGSMTIIASEFGTLMKSTPEGMYDTLTDLFDCRAEYAHSTRAHGDEIVRNPCLNLLGCTTPAWISANPTYMVGGGFSSRVIFVHEEKARQRIMYYKDHWDSLGLRWRDFERWNEDLLFDLQVISQLEGEFSIPSVALRSKIEEWYTEHTSQISSTKSDVIAGFHNRKHVHLHKLMMLLSVSESDDLRIRDHHFERAVDILNYVEYRLDNALLSVGTNSSADSIFMVRDFIAQGAGDWVTKKDILRHFISRIDEAELDTLLGALITMEEIKVTEKKGRPAYRLA